MSRSAFSSIELIVVMVIIMIIAAVTVPNYLKSSSSLGLKSSAREIEKAIRHARGLAVARRENITLVVDTAADRYWIEDSSGTVLDKVYSVHKGTDISSTTFSSDSVEFEPNGSGVWGAAANEIIVQNASGNSIRISVVGTTGRVKVE